MKNWFKKLFETPEYKIVYKNSMRGIRTSLFWSAEITLYLIVKVDEKRHKYKCYVTDGDLEQRYDIMLAMIQFPDLEPIMNKYNIID